MGSRTHTARPALPLAVVGTVIAVLAVTCVLQRGHRQHVWFEEAPITPITIYDSGQPAVSAGVAPRGKGVRMAGRWPLPDVQLGLLWPENGTCVLNEVVCRNPDRWFMGNDADPHVRDLISSCLHKCLFRAPGSCRAADLGGNAGIMTATMAAFGAEVITVEPQTDLCGVIKRTAGLNGWSARSTVHCAGVGIDATPGDNLTVVNGFRLGSGDGHTRSFTVPLIALADLLPHGHYDFVKIDTDSIDCPILERLTAMMRSGAWSFDSFVLETWAGNCRGGRLAGTLAELQGMNFTVYRTLLWERHFGADGGLPTPLAVEKLPDFAQEQFDLRFSRYLWKLAVMSKDEWVKVMEPKIWQLFITREPLASAPMAIVERT